MSADSQRVVRVGDIIGMVEVCALLGRRQSTVHQWRVQGKFDFPEPITRLGDRDLFDINDIRDWLNQHPDLSRSRG